MTDAADCDSVSNTASVATSNDGTATDDASVVVNCPDIEVAKVPDDGAVNAGDSRHVHDHGRATSAPAPRRASRSPTISPPARPGRSAPSAATPPACPAPSAAPTGSQDLTCTDRHSLIGPSRTRSPCRSAPRSTDKTDCGAIDNTASATATNEPSDKLANNSDSGSITVLCAAIEITKVADSATVNAGDPIGFTIRVTNSGDGVARNVSSSDTLDPAFTWTLGAHDDGWTLVGNTLTFTAGSFASEATAAAHVSAVSTPADCRVVNNTATVSASNDGSAQAEASVTIQCPDITVVKTAVATPVSAGDPIEFDITVSNSNIAGTGTAYKVNLTDPLPNGITWSEDSTACSITGTGDDQVLSCNWESLAKGASATVRISGTTSPAVCGNVPNTATVSAENEKQADADDNSSTATVVVNCPDITVVKTAVATPVSAGDPIAFDITVSNSNIAGTGTAYKVNLTDPLPNGITWSEDSTACSITGTGDDQVLSCNWESLAKGASATVRISGTTSPAVCGNVPNTATVSAENEKQADADDNSSTATVVVNCPDIHVEKVGNGPLNAG